MALAWKDLPCKEQTKVTTKKEGKCIRDTPGTEYSFTRVTIQMQVNISKSQPTLAMLTVLATG